MNMIDALESRRLFAVTTMYDPQRQILRFFGNERQDVVLFSQGQPGETLRARVNGQDQRFTQPIRLISMSMGEGADTVILGQIDIPLIVRGGKGADTISGGRGNDTLMGNGGFDYIYGRQGDDQLNGGLQGDSILGANGDDSITSGSALLANDDVISGGNGLDVVGYTEAAVEAFLEIGNPNADPSTTSDFVMDDVEVVLGTTGNDRITNTSSNGIEIRGGAGHDLLVGGSGADTLVGGPGNDTLNGTGGNDLFDTRDSEPDTINGGGGVNSLRRTDDLLDVVTLVP